MKVRDLVSEWQSKARPTSPDYSYQVQLPVYAAARVAALRDIFPDLDEERILTDLVAAALDDLTSSFAYEPGDEIAGYDEQGEPMYTDAGLTPRFQALAQRYARELARE